MSIWLLFLIAILPDLLKWIIDLIHGGQRMTAGEADEFRLLMDMSKKRLELLEDCDTRGLLNSRRKRKLKELIDTYNKIKAVSGEAGCQI